MRYPTPNSDIFQIQQSVRPPGAINQNRSSLTKPIVQISSTKQEDDVNKKSTFVSINLHNDDDHKKEDSLKRPKPDL